MHPPPPSPATAAPAPAFFHPKMRLLSPPLLFGLCGCATVVGQQRTAARWSPYLLHGQAPPAGAPSLPSSGRRAGPPRPTSLLLLDGARNPSCPLDSTHGHGEPARGAAGTSLPPISSPCVKEGCHGERSCCECLFKRRWAPWRSHGRNLISSIQSMETLLLLFGTSLPSHLPA